MIPLHIAKSDKIDEWVELKEDLNKANRELREFHNKYEQELVELEKLSSLAYIDEGNVYIKKEKYDKTWGKLGSTTEKINVWTYTQKVRNIGDTLLDLTGGILDVKRTVELIQERITIINNEALQQFEQQSK